MDERSSDAELSDSKPNARSSRRVQGSRVLLGIALLGAALAIGALHTIVLSIVAGVLALALAIGWGGGEPFRARRPATILLGVAVCLTAFTALQALPLPAGLLTRLAPANADVWARSLVALNQPGPSLAPITLDPAATHVEVLRGVVYVMTFLLAVRIANRRQGIVFLEGAVVLTGLTVAVAALLHPAFGVDKVFGVYTHNPAISPRHVAPLLNANHLAAYITIAFSIAFANALAPRPEIPRLLSMTVTAVLVAIQLWVASRGGVLGMIVAAVLIVALSRSSAAHRRGLSTGIALLVVVVAGIGMAVLSASDDAWTELASFSDSKSAAVRQAFHMIPSFPVLGAGRGAFQSVFPAFRTSMGYGDVTHPENVVAQWVCEWGVPVAVVAAALIVFALRPAVALSRSRPTVGPWVAIVAVALHNLVDFSSEVPAVVMALVVCAAICVAGSADATRRSRLELWSGRPKALAAACVAAAALVVVWVVPDLQHGIDDERETLQKQALDTGTSLAAFHDLARAAMLRHPAEPYFPFAGAVRASRARDETIMPWIERTFERAPVYGPAHLLLARSLVRASPSQARMEYRFAAEQYSGLGGYTVSEGLPLVRSYDDAMELVPRGPAALGVLEGLSEGLSTRLPATRVRLDEEILARDPRALAPRERRVADAVADVEAGAAAPWCTDDRAACVARGEEAAKELIDLEPSHCAPYRLEAELFVAAGDTARALDILQRAAEKVNDREVCLDALAKMAREAHDETREGIALEKLEHAGCAGDADCYQTWMNLAHLQEARGEKAHAMALLKKVLARWPDDDAALSEEAELAGALGMHAEALAAYTRLEQRHPGDARYAGAASAQRAALFQPGP